LLAAIQSFAHQGNRVEMTFGADSFSRESRGSDYQAIETLVQTIGGQPSVKLHLYHEQRRTFHPKLYLFSNEAERRALLIVGSSNWSTGGFVQNVEANLLVRLDLNDSVHQQCYSNAQRCFRNYWEET
jgi:HKD family nuclease